MRRTIDGRRYIMRDQRPVKVLREMFMAYCQKYGEITFHRWMVERGKVSVTIRQEPPRKRRA